MGQVKMDTISLLLNEQIDQRIMDFHIKGTATTSIVIPAKHNEPGGPVLVLVVRLEIENSGKAKLYGCLDWKLPPMHIKQVSIDATFLQRCDTAMSDAEAWGERVLAMGVL